MNLFDVSTIVFVTLIIVKIMVYHGIKNLQQKQWYLENICVNGYYGLSADPFECDAYYSCPQMIKLYCENGTEFDADKSECVPYDAVNGCYEKMLRRLLL
ncbi:hypothetical protein SlGVgp009 [Spodoptera litura granulovirus]|jgi:hypothetical protein|uniref:Chitin-binding type-2 domain-containing protein n=1 Tax=Spodoptera litura granulovirus TaxID=359919 RepID=A5IZL1_9BBAC|nr:hypothetical protein SlGVgp009 [Spodoptera litura granulovirus]ABQ51952.1 hypothetical protein SlGVgp009 [Spodoptera litura granulovirus]